MKKDNETLMIDEKDHMRCLDDVLEEKEELFNEIKEKLKQENLW